LLSKPGAERRTANEFRDYVIMTRLFDYNDFRKFIDKIPPQIRETVESVESPYYEHYHPGAVGALCARIAVELAKRAGEKKINVTAVERKELDLLAADGGKWAFFMGYCHDVGKFTNPEMRKLFLAPGKWPRPLKKLGGRHPEESERFLSNFDVPQEILKAVMFHHRLQGYPNSGRYPRDLKHPSLGTKILEVADSIHAMYWRQKGKPSGYGKARTLRGHLENLIKSKRYGPRVLSVLLEFVRSENEVIEKNGVRKSLPNAESVPRRPLFSTRELAMRNQLPFSPKRR